MKIGVEKKIFSEYYKLLNMFYCNMEKGLNVGYVVGKFSELTEKFDNHPLAVELATACIAQIDYAMKGIEIKGKKSVDWDYVLEGFR